MDRKLDPRGAILQEGNAVQGRKLFPVMGLPFLILTLAGGLVFFFAGWAWPGNPAAEVTYSLKTFQDGKARFYEYKTPNGVTVKYFILKSSDGVVRAAFDACDVCWPEGKGYVQKGDFMVCRNCGRRFASVKVNVITGGCNPGALQRQVAGDQLVIKVKDIIDGKKYFNFAKRG
jgi:ribosomal protein S14